MKNFKKILFVLIIVFVIYAHGTLAVQKAVFPDSKKLQPAPVDIHPNISKNINSSSGTQANQTINFTKNQNKPNSPDNFKSSKPDSGNFLSLSNPLVQFILLTVLLFVSAGIMYIIKKRKVV